MISVLQHASRLGKWRGDLSDFFWLTEAQMTRLAPFFAKSHGKPRVDDRRVLSGIIFIKRNGLRWRADEPFRGIVPSTMANDDRSTCSSPPDPFSAMLASPARQRVSDDIGARALLSGLPNVKWLLGARGYDADWFREALQDKGMRACIPGRTKRKTPVKHDKRRYKRRNRPSQRMHAFACRATIEIMFGRLKGLEARRHPP